MSPTNGGSNTPNGMDKTTDEHVAMQIPPSESQDNQILRMQAQIDRLMAMLGSQTTARKLEMDEGKLTLNELSEGAKTARDPQGTRSNAGSIAKTN